MNELTCPCFMKTDLDLSSRLTNYPFLKKTIPA